MGIRALDLIQRVGREALSISQSTFSQPRTEKVMDERHIVTVDGVEGFLIGPLSDVVGLAKVLLLEGFGIKVDNAKVALWHGPGYDTVIFAAGPRTNEEVDPRDASRDGG